MDNVFHVTIKSGKIRYHNPPAFESLLSTLDGNYLVSISKPKSKRSLEANKYLWGVVYKAVADSTGNDAESIHEFCKLKFNAKHVTLPDKKTGELEEMKIGGSTAKMNSGEFWKFIDEVCLFFEQDYGIKIPKPGELPEEQLTENV